MREAQNVGYWFGVNPCGRAMMLGAKVLKYQLKMFYMAHDHFAEKDQTSRRRAAVPPVSTHGIIWRSYSSDGNFSGWGYMRGTKDLEVVIFEADSREAKSMSGYGEDITGAWLASSLYDACQGMWGAARLKLYDRSTGKEIDEIC